MCSNGLFRLAVRTSRCGRDNPGSNPGRDILPSAVESAYADVSV